MGKMDVKSSHVYLVLCYETITKGKLTVGKMGLRKLKYNQCWSRPVDITIVRGCTP